jgi:LmbE family N-acetylglucosaminyl deacetylase
MKNGKAPEHRVLCVFAHPDDESFSCAGTISKYAGQGVAFHLLTFTRGQAGVRPEPLKDDETLALLREYELRAAAEVLGVQGVTLLNYADGELDKIPIEELIDQVQRCLDDTGADTVITFGPRGLTNHSDHKAAHQAALAAAEEYGRRLRVLLIAVDASEMNEVHGPESAPTHRIDVTAYRDRKLAALACHCSQKDARDLFLSLSRKERDEERYHQAYPPLSGGRTTTDLFDDAADQNGRPKTLFRIERTG